jgi:hypothetical protein
MSIIATGSNFQRSVIERVNSQLKKQPYLDRIRGVKPVATDALFFIALLLNSAFWGYAFFSFYYYRSRKGSLGQTSKP